MKKIQWVIFGSIGVNQALLMLFSFSLYDVWQFHLYHSVLRQCFAQAGQCWFRTRVSDRILLQGPVCCKVSGKVKREINRTKIFEIIFNFRKQGLIGLFILFWSIRASNHTIITCLGATLCQWNYIGTKGCLLLWERSQWGQWEIRLHDLPYSTKRWAVYTK